METIELGDINGDKTFELLGYIQQWVGARRPWRYTERELYRVMTAALRSELYQAHRLVSGQLPGLNTAGRERLDRLAEAWMRTFSDWNEGVDLADCDRIAGAVLAARAREDGLDQMLD